MATRLALCLAVSLVLAGPAAAAAPPALNCVYDTLNAADRAFVAQAMVYSEPESAEMAAAIAKAEGAANTCMTAYGLTMSKTQTIFEYGVSRMAYELQVADLGRAGVTETPLLNIWDVLDANQRAELASAEISDEFIDEMKATLVAVGVPGPSVTDAFMALIDRARMTQIEAAWSTQ